MTLEKFYSIEGAYFFTRYTQNCEYVVEFKARRPGTSYGGGRVTPGTTAICPWATLSIIAPVVTSKS